MSHPFLGASCNEKKKKKSQVVSIVWDLDLLDLPWRILFHEGVDLKIIHGYMNVLERAYEITFAKDIGRGGARIFCLGGQILVLIY